MVSSGGDLDATVKILFPFILTVTTRRLVLNDGTIQNQAAFFVVRSGTDNPSKHVHVTYSIQKSLGCTAILSIIHLNIDPEFSSRHQGSGRT